MKKSGTLLSDFSSILLNIRVCECATKTCQVPHEIDVTGSEFSGSAACKTTVKYNIARSTRLELQSKPNISVY